MAKRKTNNKQGKTEPRGLRLLSQQATGSDDKNLQTELITQVHNSLWLPEGLSNEKLLARAAGALSLLEGIKPEDEIEGMLAAQMVATHSAAMECLRRAMIPTLSLIGRDQNLKHATKLLSIYSRQIETLDKHRGKGQQKITVEHVSVEAGGQAMVGHIEIEKPQKPQRQRAKRSTKAIPDNPGQTIDMDVVVKEPAKKRSS